MANPHSNVPARLPDPSQTFSDSDYSRGVSVLENPSFLDGPVRRLRSNLEIWTRAYCVGVLVFLIALGIQWVIYDRIMHEDGIRIVGSALAAVIAAFLVQTLETAARNQQQRELKRLEVIALLNHHIRNALQAIVNSSGSSDSTNTIRNSVERIEWALGSVLQDLAPPRRNAAPSGKH
jgi:hypothetical protein